MVPQTSSLVRFFLLLGVLSLAACAGERPDGPLQSKGFSRPAASEVIAAGLDNITERYIELIGPEDFAAEGLRGLGAIDPEIAIEQVANNIILRIGSKTIARYPQPGKGDTTAWTDLMVNVSVAARTRSKELGHATPEKIYEAIFDGILSHLDIYSRYAGAHEAGKNRAKRDGFGGIGIRIKIVRNEPLITAVMPKTPALRAGLKINDTITHINGSPTTGLSRDTLGEQIRGTVKSHARLQIKRPGVESSLHFDIERTHIVPETVTYAQQDGIVYLKISSFNQRTAHNLLEKMKKATGRLGKRLKGVILDMRGNPGGLLKQSIKVADLFLAQGKISQTGGRHPDSVQYYEAGGRDMAFGKPIVVLIDGMSASASEVTAAALQDRGRAVVVGTSSFGKGTVQTVLRLPNDGEMTLTWSRLMAPSGYIIHELGVFPTICTSGTLDDGDNLFDNIPAQRIRTSAVLDAWHRIGFDDKKARQALRAFCPPERRRLDTDTKIARRLIENKMLYTRMLNLTASASAAR